MKNIFFNSRGLRAGWRLLIFVGINVGLVALADALFTKVLPQSRQRYSILE